MTGTFIDVMIDKLYQLSIFVLYLHGVFTKQKTNNNQNYQLLEYECLDSLPESCYVRKRTHWYFNAMESNFTHLQNYRNILRLLNRV